MNTLNYNKYNKSGEYLEIGDGTLGVPGLILRKVCTALYR